VLSYFTFCLQGVFPCAQCAQLHPQLGSIAHASARIQPYYSLLHDGLAPAAQWPQCPPLPPLILLLAYKAYVFIDSRGADSGQPALLKRRAEGSPGSGRSSSGRSY